MGTPAALAASQNERWGVYQFSQLVRKRQEKCWGYVIIGELDFQERLKSHDLEEQKEIGVLGYIQVSWVSKNVYSHTTTKNRKKSGCLVIYR